jgi:hypothetical protein
VPRTFPCADEAFTTKLPRGNGTEAEVSKPVSYLDPKGKGDRSGHEKARLDKYLFQGVSGNSHRANLDW